MIYKVLSVLYSTFVFLGPNLESQLFKENFQAVEYNWFEQ